MFGFSSVDQNLECAARGVRRETQGARQPHTRNHQGRAVKKHFFDENPQKYFYPRYFLPTIFDDLDDLGHTRLMHANVVGMIHRKTGAFIVDTNSSGSQPFSAKISRILRVFVCFWWIFEGFYGFGVGSC